MKKVNLPALFGGIFFCTVSLFTGCENFLDGSELKEKLDSAIEYANASECTVTILQDKTTGTFFSNIKETLKLGYDFELKFTTDPDKYLFRGLEAVSSSDETISRSDCIDFTLNEEAGNETKGIYVIKLLLKKTAPDILIRPVCSIIPEITSVSPGSSEIAISYKPVTVTFNRPMESPDTAAEDSIFNYDTISIKRGDEDVTAYFEQPVFNSAKTSLSLIPKYAEFNAYLSKYDNSQATFTVSFNSAISAKDGEYDPIPLKKDSSKSFLVLYMAGTDTESPAFDNLFITDEEISLKTFSSLSQDKIFVDKDINDFNEEDYFTNRTLDRTVYIYGSCKDTGSGVKSVTVSYQKINERHAHQLGIISKNYRDGDEEAEFFTDEDGTTRFCIKQDLEEYDRRDNRVYEIHLSAIDACNNSADSDALYAYNCDWSFSLADDMTRPLVISNTIDSPATLLIEDSIYGWTNDDRAYFEYSPEGRYHFKDTKYYCEYTDKTGKVCKEEFITDTQTGDRKITLNAEQLNGLKFNVIAAVMCNGKERILGTIENGLPSLPEATITDNTLKFSRWANIYRRTAGSGELEELEFTYSGYPLEAGIEYYVTPVTNISEGWAESMFEPFTYSRYGTRTGPYTAETFKPASPVVYGYTLAEGPSYDKINIIFDLGEWENDYDYITTSERRNFFPGENVENWFFTSGFLPDTKTLTIYGVKNGIKSEGFTWTHRKTDVTDEEKLHADFTAPQILTDNYYLDFTLPEDLKKCRTDWQNTYLRYSVSEESTESGLKTGGYHAVLNGKQYDGADSLIMVPYESLHFGTNDIFTHAEDNAGNSRNLTKFIYLDYETPLVWKSEKSGSGTSAQFKVYFLADGLLDRFIRSPIGEMSLCKFSNNSWTTGSWTTGTPIISKTGYTTTNQTTAYSPEQNVSRPHYTETTCEMFIKLHIACYDTHGITVNGNKYEILLNKYEIYYTGSNTGTGDFNLLYKNGTSKSSMAVQSDAPVFIHTLVTTHPYEECKDWDLMQWETFPRELGAKQIDFSSSDHAARRYSIPVDEMNENEKCYVVIAHYADDTTAMSEVMQK